MVKLLCGDSLKVLPNLPTNSVDAVVTDPPYELAFMGKKWDASGIAHNVDLWREVLRVLKPGGHLLAFGGTRTHHRMTCAIEDAGFEIRDELDWLYGSGFPKSHDVSKALDKAAGAEREVIGHKGGRYDSPCTDIRGGNYGNGQPNAIDLGAITAPATDAAKQWEGWGTALKPAREPIILARKPFDGTVAENVQQFGTGAINIDACRIEANGRPLRVGDYKATADNVYAGRQDGSLQGGSRAVGNTDIGRWPANVLLDEDAAALLDEQSGETRDGWAGGSDKPGCFQQGVTLTAPHPGCGGGGASRFFYVAKASRKERDAGCGKNTHPTVKPIALMRYLCRLITPPNGIVLDPFMGSGSTGCAAVLEGFRFCGIEKEQPSYDTAKARIEYWQNQSKTNKSEGDKPKSDKPTKTSNQHVLDLW